MQTIGIGQGNVLMALATSLKGIGFTAYAKVGFFLGLKSAITPMTVNTTLLAVNRGQELLITNKHFFPTLQRRDRTTSAFTF